MEDKPNYYAIIPAEVRYDNDLRPGAKIFYGEITALCSKNGMCTASNSYFADLYNMTASGISKWITQLKDKGYISVKYIKNGEEIKKRVIKINGFETSNLTMKKVLTNVNRGSDKKHIGVVTYVKGGSDKKSKRIIQEINNTSNNNTSKRKYIKESEKVVSRLNELNGTNYRPSTEETLKLIKARLEDGYSLEELLLVVDKMSYLWNREPKKNEKDMRPYLRPSTLFRKTNFENYLNMPVNKSRDLRYDKTIDITEVFK